MSELTIDLAVKGVISEKEAAARIPELKSQIVQVELELASLEEAPKIIALHPATLEKYLETVNRLPAVLADHAGSEDDRGPLIKDLRSLIHSVVVHPEAPRKGFKIEVKGKLAVLIGGKVFPQARYSGSRVVAEERYRLSTHHPNLRYCLRAYA